jgi:hypothetical protein
MSFNTMVQRLTLEVPNLSAPFARTLLNDALLEIEDEQLWSFQLKESNWITPGLLFPTVGGLGTSTGTITARIGSSAIIGDVNASAQWATYAASSPFAPLTVCQIRNPSYSLYNIISYDITSNPPFGTLTLDRPWMEPAGTTLPYMIYQAYFPVPVSNFRRFTAARDTSNSTPMDWWSKTQKMLGSPTLGNMLYELWPHPLAELPYTFNYIYQGPQLVLPTDAVPYPLTEKLVRVKAEGTAYLFKEAQKGENVERGAGANFRFLAEAAEARYKKLKKDISMKDRDLVELYVNKFCPNVELSQDGFATINGGLNVGRI